MANMNGQLFKFPEKRESREVELIFLREFGRIICPHKVYLPNQSCGPCADKAAKEVEEILFACKQARVVMQPQKELVSVTATVAAKPCFVERKTDLQRSNDQEQVMVTRKNRIMNWAKNFFGRLHKSIKEEQRNILHCSGGCGRTMDAGREVPDFHSRMLPLFMDGVPRYERYTYQTGFKCFACCERDYTKQ